MTDAPYIAHWAKLFSQDFWATIVVGSERQLDTLAAYAPADIEVRTVRGYRCADQDSVFNECAAALQFPYYFGRNWAAFDDCVADLSWLRKPKIAIFIACSDTLLSSEPAHFERFIDGLRDGVIEPVRMWMHDRPTPSRELRVVFHSDSAEAVLARLGPYADGVGAVELPSDSSEELD